MSNTVLVDGYTAQDFIDQYIETGNRPGHNTFGHQVGEDGQVYACLIGNLCTLHGIIMAYGSTRFRALSEATGKPVPYLHGLSDGYEQEREYFDSHYDEDYVTEETRRQYEQGYVDGANARVPVDAEFGAWHWSDDDDE